MNVPKPIYRYSLRSASAVPTSDMSLSSTGAALNASSPRGPEFAASGGARAGPGGAKHPFRHKPPYRIATLINNYIHISIPPAHEHSRITGAYLGPRKDKRHSNAVLASEISRCIITTQNCRLPLPCVYLLLSGELRQSPVCVLVYRSGCDP